MNRREFLKAAAASTMMCAASSVAASNAAKRPNVVFIMADDLSPQHFGCYGNAEAKTPNIDRLAKEGVLFDTCWTAPMCAPSRAMLITGRYATRTGVWHNALKTERGGADLLGTKHRLLASMLRESGYATAIAGKSMEIGAMLGTPETGFDEYCCHQGSGILPGGGKFDGLYEAEAGMAKGYGARAVTSRYWHPCIIRNGEQVKTGPSDFGEDIYTGFIADFMKRNAAKPFFLYYSMELPHGTAAPEGSKIPTTPLSGRPGKNAGGSIRECTDYIDVCVGNVLNALDNLGLRENTIVFFTADNSDAGGGKTRATERGARVPMVVAGPGIVKKRGKTAELVSFADIYPTLAEFAGAAIPSGYELDGQSMASFLRGDTDTHREWLFSYIGTAVMIRDRRYLIEAIDAPGGFPEGRFYDCGTNRSTIGYVEVTKPDGDALAARTRLENILAGLPLLDMNDPAVKRIVDAYLKTPFVHKLEDAGKPARAMK